LKRKQAKKPGKFKKIAVKNQNIMTQLNTKEGRD